MMKERIPLYDRIKGFAILCVVIGHIIIGNVLGRREYGGADTLLGIITAFNMPLFMFVSGILTNNHQTLFKFSKKILKLFIPASLFGLTYAYLEKETIHSFLFDNYKNGYWYLYVLLFFYLIHLVFYNNKKEGTKGFLIDLLVFTSILVFLMIFYHFGQEKLNSLLSIERCLRMWPAFGIGMISSKYNLINRVFECKNIWFTLSICMVAISKFLAMRTSGYLFDVINAVYNISFVYAIIYLFMQRQTEKNNRIESILCVLGCNSLYIYILHFFILRLINLKRWGFWLFDTNNILIELGIALILAIPISFLCIYIAKLIRQSSLISKIIFGELL